MFATEVKPESYAVSGRRGARDNGEQSGTVGVAEDDAEDDCQHADQNEVAGSRKRKRPVPSMRPLADGDDHLPGENGDCYGEDDDDGADDGLPGQKK